LIFNYLTVELRLVKHNYHGTSESLLFNIPSSKNRIGIRGWRIAYVNRHPNRLVDSVHTINPDYTISSIYEWSDESLLEKIILRLEILNKGDIIGMGSATDYINNTKN